jgi:hypothetical protein
VNRNHEFTTTISIETIHQSMPVKFHSSRDYLNRSMITETLISLKKKKVIEYEIDNKLLLDKKKGKNISLDIIFKPFTDKSGFIQFTYDEFYEIENIYYFYIIVATRRYDNVNYQKSGLYGRWISEQEFGDLLGVSKETFRKRANELINQGKLFKLTGNRESNERERDKNRYRTIPFSREQSVEAGKYESRHSGRDDVYDKDRGKIKEKRYLWGNVEDVF